MISNTQGLAARQVVWQVLQAVSAGAYTDVALERELRRAELPPRDRALATELAYGAIRQRRLLDTWLDLLGNVPAEKQPPKLRWLLHLGLYQLLRCERIPATAAVNTTVELAKRGGLERLAPVANGVLREFLRQQKANVCIEGSSDRVSACAIRHSLPDWLARDILKWGSDEQLEKFGLASNRTPNLDLRVNTMRTDVKRLKKRFEDAAISVSSIDGLPGALGLQGRTGDIRLLPGYHEGQWTIQDRAAQRVAPALGVKPGDRVLDACAAPGGKTTHLAEIMSDQGSILAIDLHQSRLKRIRQNAERLELKSIQTLRADATTLAKDYPDLANSFDAILVDAPCSGLGTLARHPDLRWRLNEDSVSELVKLQLAILFSVQACLKPGGRIVYSTCSIHPLENSGVIGSFLNEYSGFNLQSEWTNWPGESGDGFYVATLCR